MPKTLVKIQGKPIIWYIVKFLKKNSFNHFILPVGYKGMQIKKYISKERDFNNMNIEIVNTGENSSISKRIDKIKKNIKSDNFLLLNGDAIFNFNLKKFFQNIVKKYAISFFGCATQLPYGVVGMINKKIVSFERDINFNGVFSRNIKNFVGYVYSGISIINKNLLKIRFKHFKNFEKELFPKIIKKKDQILNTSMVFGAQLTMKKTYTF